MANIFKSYSKSTVGTAVSDVYTVPNGTVSVVIGCVLTNTSATDPVYGNVIVDKSNSLDTVYLVKDIPLFIGGAYEFNSGNKIILETGDKLQVSSNTALSIDVLVSVLEQSWGN